MMSPSAMAGDSANYYLDLAREDYYLNGGEPPGVWWGRGANDLNLSGPVEKNDLLNLFKGFSPDGLPLVQNAGVKGKDRQPGWDLTFSAPKSVSTLWSQGDDALRREIQAAHFEAVKAGLIYIEDDLVFTRRGKAGGLKEPAKLIAAIFEHSTSRDMDPQLHTHALVMNACKRTDGTFGSIVSKSFYQDKMVIGALYRTELASQLEQRLGVRCELDERGFAFTLKGSNSELDKFFSKRRNVIEERLKSRGVESAAAAATATLDTRKTKDKIPSRSTLFETWKEQGEKLRFNPGRILGFEKRISDDAVSFRKALNLALNKMTESDSHFSKKDLIKGVSVQGQILCLSSKFVRNQIQDALKNYKQIIALGQFKGEQRYTIKAVLEAEKALIKSADSLSENHLHGVSSRIIDKIIAKTQKPMNSEQKRAVEQLTRKGSGLRSLEGLAGTGKTTTLDVAREILEKAGYKIIGAATSGKAARELHEGAKIKGVTIAKLDFMINPSLSYKLAHHAEQILRAVGGKTTYKLEPFKFDKKTALILDEAAMISTKDLAKLVAAVEKGGGMLISVFDRKQLQAIGPGGGAAFLADRHGKAELKTIVRQHDVCDIKVVESFASGKAEDALRSMAERGKIYVGSDRAAAIRKLVSHWAENEAGKREKTLIFAGTRTEVADLNERCQAARLRDREIKGECYSKAGLTIYKGDRILFTQNSSSIGVDNGSLGTIIDLKNFRQVATVKLDTGDTVTVPLKSYKSLQLGYAVTTHKGQGTTVDNAYLLAGGRMQDKELSYVQASRARLNTLIFTDKNEAGENFSRLAKQMNRSREKILAHEIATREERESEAFRIRKAMRI